MQGDDLSPIEGHIQEAFNNVTSALGPMISAHALVVAVPGVKGMLLRTMFRGSAIRSIKPYPSKIFDSIPLGVSWLAQQVPVEEMKICRWAQRLASGQSTSEGGSSSGEPSADEVTKRFAS